ncbi:MAG TPA: tetratricopeptide repeat protein [Mesorhizobium sp.]
MKFGAGIALCALAVCGGCVAGPNPSQISWEWFNVAETYKAYPRRTEADLRISAHYYALAANKGNAAAAYKLAEMYENGAGVAKDDDAALKWYRAAAVAGDKYGQFRVGWFYQHGLSTPKDMQQARLWYERSAKQDNEWAYHMLAFMLADGDGVGQDTALARTYFERSLPRTNDNWAKWKLAMLVEDSDPRRARQLLAESAAAGNVQAGEELRRKDW